MRQETLKPLYSYGSMHRLNLAYEVSQDITTCRGRCQQVAPSHKRPNTHSFSLIIGLPKLQVHTIVVMSLPTATYICSGTPICNADRIPTCPCALYIKQEGVLRAFENIRLLEKKTA